MHGLTLRKGLESACELLAATALALSADACSTSERLASPGAQLRAQRTASALHRADMLAVAYPQEQNLLAGHA
jgi:hypothetical protein